jgi:hypothetical protein
MTNLQFYLEEAKGNVDYQGYIFPRHRGESVSILLKLMHSLCQQKKYCNAVAMLLPPLLPVMKQTTLFSSLMLVAVQLKAVIPT